MPRSDHLRVELETSVKRLTPSELLECLASLDLVEVSVRPTAAIRGERDQRGDL